MSDAGQRERRVLVLVRGAHEGELTRRLLVEAGLHCEACRDSEELCRKLQEGAGTALLAEELLSRAVLAQLEHLLAEQPAWSDFPMLVFSAAAVTHDTRGLALAALGNVSFLDRPVHVRTMVAAVRAALRTRARQYEARRAIESRDAFLAMLGHELRNPLGAITFALLALDRKSSGGARPNEYGIMERQVRHLSRLVDELLDVARVTHGKVAIDKHPVDLAEVAQGAFEAYAPRAKEQSLEYSLELELRPLWVLGDRQRLEQVVGNLLTNAIKYTPSGGQVRLHLAADAHSACLRVVDSGVGLAEEMRERIFAPFVQVDSSLDRSQGGLGLGLALVQSLVQLHGGRVSASSDGVGRGSRFEIVLPRAPMPSASPPPADSAHQQASLRVVLVEDNGDIRELFTELLRESGHAVTAAGDGPSGLQALLSLRPDIAFVDVGLPGFDGYELARRARAEGSNARLVALTGYGQKEDRTRARDAGFDEHLVKPVAHEDIRHALSRANPAPELRHHSSA
jgi:signal transduction histidine kinase/CheY-like chemotaxis protein